MADPQGGPAIRLGPGDAAPQVGALLCGFRLLEAAGACGVIAARLSEACRPRRPPEWWEALADGARTYRSAIDRTTVQGFSAIDEWAQSETAGDDADLLHERTRLGFEYREWLCEVHGGQAYVAWLSAYVAVVELDGERALKSLDRCAAIVHEFTEAPGLGDEPSVYDLLQSAADTLTSFLPLVEHPLRDMRRFAFLPRPLLSG